MSLRVCVSKRLGSFCLQADFTADREPLALLGASGCGKSVTLRCVAGILKPDEGHIELDGETLFDSAGKIDLPPQRRNVGYLFQQYALFPNLTVRQNIAVAIRDKSRREAETGELLFTPPSAVRMQRRLGREAQSCRRKTQASPRP